QHGGPGHRAGDAGSDDRDRSLGCLRRLTGAGSAGSAGPAESAESARPIGSADSAESAGPRAVQVASSEPARISANDAAIGTVKGSDRKATPAATATAGLM